jgi:hypothetical protein
MWKQVLPPVVLVTALWVAMSVATTYYVQWVDNSYQRVSRENLSSIRAADDLQQTLWRIVGEWPSDSSEVESFQAHWTMISDDLARHEKQFQVYAHNAV